MATHDYIISNQTFPSTRTDLNNVLSAIVSNNSNSTAPSTTYAYMWWYDISTTTLKFRNADDDAWVSFATFDMSNDTVNFLDSTVTITGLATSATGTTFTLSDTDNKSSVDFIIDNEKKIKLREATANGTNAISFKSPSSLSQDYDFTLPSDYGSADQVLKTNGSGTLSWGDVAGRTGTVDWNTTPKTSTFTAINGDGFFANTTSGAFTVNLPAGSAGAIVSLADYAATWQTNNLTVTPNGTDKIGGIDTSVTLNTEGQSVTFVFVDSTQGWVNTMDSTSNERGNPNLIASVSGSCNTLVTAPDCSNVKIATFVGPGSFTVSNASSTAANNVVSYMVTAGGGGGGGSLAGGGAGGFREYKSPVTPYTASPLDGNPGGTSITVTAQAYPITVGGGGAASTCNSNKGSNGGNSTFSSITSTGGGAGAGFNVPTRDGNPGGSGGSNSYVPGNPTVGNVGLGNTPPVTPPQGSNAGTSNSDSATYTTGGGGGGATAVGAAANSSTGGAGGAGVTTNITASPVAYAGGGGGGTDNGGKGVGCGGAGGGGKGTSPPGGTPAPQRPGAVNTGGGGGGGLGSSSTSGAGGSGIVVIRYKFQ